MTDSSTGHDPSFLATTEYLDWRHDNVQRFTQAAIGDKELIRGMIPHHSGAILMCGKAKLSDPELVALCGEIVEAQEREIRQMQAIQDRL